MSLVQTNKHTGVVTVLFKNVLVVSLAISILLPGYITIFASANPPSVVCCYVNSVTCAQALVAKHCWSYCYWHDDFGEVDPGWQYFGYWYCGDVDQEISVLDCESFERTTPDQYNAPGFKDSKTNPDVVACNSVYDCSCSVADPPAVGTEPAICTPGGNDLNNLTANFDIVDQESGECPDQE